MGIRRKARELTVKFLYWQEINPGDPLEELESFWSLYSQAQKIKEFSSSLIMGIIEKKAEIDEVISQAAINWDLNRIAIIDKSILRLAIYEILYRDDIPTIVSINEAIDIAKKYSTAESGKFVNGILDNIRGPEKTDEDGNA